MNKFFNIKTGLIVGFGLTLILAAALLFTIVSPYFEKTTTQSNTKIFSDDTTIIVSSEITAGVPFDYRAVGTKYVDAGAIIKTQLVCEQANNAESIFSIGEIYSNAPKGNLDVERVVTIPINQRIYSSDRCHLEYFGVYQLYQSGPGNTERQIDIPAIVRSNDFKLTVPTTN